MADNNPMTQEEAEEIAAGMLAIQLPFLGGPTRPVLVEFLLWPVIENRQEAGFGFGSVLKRLPWIEVSEWGCANLVKKAEKGELLSIMAARELAAELIERGRPLPESLRRFAAKTLRDSGGKTRRGRVVGDNYLRDCSLHDAYNKLVSRGCNKKVALEAVYRAQIGRVKPMVDRDRLRRFCARPPVLNSPI